MKGKRQDRGKRKTEKHKFKKNKKNESDERQKQQQVGVHEKIRGATTDKNGEEEAIITPDLQLHRRAHGAYFIQHRNLWEVVGNNEVEAGRPCRFGALGYQRIYLFISETLNFNIYLY